MSGTLVASQVKPGVRRSKKYESGRICDFLGGETVLSTYNKKKFSTPKFKIGTNFFCNSSGTTLDLIERINFLEKKISKLNIK